MVARCQCPLRARCRRVAAAHRLAGRCSRWVVQPRWPAPGLSPPQPHHHPLVFSASQPAPPVTAAAASALAARTSWLWLGVVALGMVTGLWPRSSAQHSRLKPDAVVGVGLQPRSGRPSQWMRPTCDVTSEVTSDLQLGLEDTAGSSFPSAEWLSPGQGTHIMVGHPPRW